MAEEALSVDAVLVVPEMQAIIGELQTQVAIERALRRRAATEVEELRQQVQLLLDLIPEGERPSGVPDADSGAATKHREGEAAS